MGRRPIAQTPARAAAAPRDDAASASGIAITGLNAEVLSFFPGYVLRRAQFQINQGVLELLAPFELRRTSFAALLLAKYNPGATPSDLADTLGIARANFVPLLDDLQQRDLVIRQPRPDDRRSQSIYLTKRGAALIGKVEPIVRAYEDKIHDDINKGGHDAIGAIHAWLKRGARP